MNSTRNAEDKGSHSSEFDFYLKSGLPAQQVASILRAQGKSEKDIDTFMVNYEVSRKKISKLVRKFAEKMNTKYGHLDVPELMKKGMKHATKNKFTAAERDAFISFVMNKNTDTPYSAFPELNYTEMSKFLGFSNMSGQTLAIKATDQPALEEIARLYENSKIIHSGIRNNLVTYSDCDANAVLSNYNKDKDNMSLYIHPLIVALFLPRIAAIEQRMLYSNVGRFVIQRSQIYFQKVNDRSVNNKYMNWSLNLGDLLPRELTADGEFMVDIAKDPNSLDHFNDESPMNNLLKRFTIQIELWKNVLSLRQGKFYSRSESYNDDSGIMGLNKVLQSYSWTYFDSPDLFHIHDEGNLLRKLLAVFSLRPILTQISGNYGQVGSNALNVAFSKPTFVYTPICNVRLPPVAPAIAAGAGVVAPQQFVNGAGGIVQLDRGLAKTDWYIENKTIVPKHTNVLHSKHVMFFYINRRSQSPVIDVNMSFNYTAVPGTLTAATSINDHQVDINQFLAINNGQQQLELRSAVVLNELEQGQYSTGCSSMVSDWDQNHFYKYNPLQVAKIHDDGHGGLTRLPPIMPVDEADFTDQVSRFGTILIFVDKAVDAQIAAGNP